MIPILRAQNNPRNRYDSIHHNVSAIALKMFSQHIPTKSHDSKTVPFEKLFPDGD
jgi:peptidyl-tRNA hydrolase